MPGDFPPDRFATLTGLQVGIGTIGTLIATAPLAFSTATIGWRNSFLLVAAFTLAWIAIAVAVVVRDRRAATAAHGPARDLAREPVRHPRRHPHAVGRAAVRS